MLDASLVYVLHFDQSDSAVQHIMGEPIIANPGWMQQTEAMHLGADSSIMFNAVLKSVVNKTGGQRST